MARFGYGCIVSDGDTLLVAESTALPSIDCRSRENSDVTTVARIIFVLFAALLILGGIAGFVEKRSVPSLAAGIVCGGLGLYAVIIIGQKPQLAFILALVGAILAIGGMMPRLKDKTTGEIKMWPAGAVVAAGIVTALVAGAGLATKAGATAPSTSSTVETTGSTKSGV